MSLENDDNTQLARSLYQKMTLIRLFEIKAAEKYRDGLMPGFIHLSLGQEACAAGACLALKEEDYITSTHRGHGHCIAKGANIKKMMAELYGKQPGYCKGRGGSMHIADPGKGILGANGIVGQSLALAIGAALTAQVRGNNSVALAFFGEGASGSGVAHEAMNIAAIWRLPVVFFCEVNKYAELSPYETHCPITNISSRAASYGFPGHTVNGEDVFEVYSATLEAVSRARRGDGPSLVEAKALRWNGHYEGDPQKYKTPEDRDNPQQFDPINFFEKKYAPEFGIADSELKKSKLEAETAINAAIEFAENALLPKLDSLVDDVYA